MSLALDTLLANIDHAVRNRTRAEIGCGVFDHVELRLAATEIRRLQTRSGRLEQDQKLLQALKGLLEDKYLADPINADRMKQANAAYHHVAGT